MADAADGNPQAGAGCPNTPGVESQTSISVTTTSCLVSVTWVDVTLPRGDLSSASPTKVGRHQRLTHTGKARYTYLSNNLPNANIPSTNTTTTTDNTIQFPL